VYLPANHVDAGALTFFWPQNLVVRTNGDPLALGAARRRGALLLAASGIVLAALGAFAATGLLTSSLFSVSRADPATFAVTATLMLLTSLVASAVPAFRGA
jgi:hypothetical protein